MMTTQPRQHLTQAEAAAVAEDILTDRISRPVQQPATDPATGTTDPDDDIRALAERIIR